MEYFYIVKYQNEKGLIYDWDGSKLILSEDGFYDEKSMLNIYDLPAELNRCYLYLKTQPASRLGLVFPVALLKDKIL